MDLTNTYRYREYYENDLPLTDLAPKLVNTISTSAKNVEAADDDNEKTHTHLNLKQILSKEITNQKHLTTLFMKTGDVSPLINLNQNLAMNVDLTKLPGVLNEQNPALLYPLAGEIKIEAKDKTLLRDPKIRLKELQDDLHTQEKSSKAEDNKGVNVDNLDSSVFQKAKIDASKATFLMRTEYSTRSKANANDSNKSATTDLRNKLFLKQQKTQKKLQRLNGSEFVERIQKSFQSLETLEDVSLKNFRHPVKKNLKPKRIWKLLPDANTMDENFISLKLNGSAAITTKEEAEKVKLNTAIFRSVQVEEDEWMSLYSLKDKKLNNELLNEQEISKDDLKNIPAEHTPKVYMFNRIRDFNIKEDTTNENHDPEVFIQFNKEENVASYKIIKKQLVLNKRRHNDLLKDIIKENNFDKLEVSYNVPTEEEQMEHDNIRAVYDPIEFPKM